MKRRRAGWWILAAVLLTGIAAAALVATARHRARIRRIVAASIPARPAISGSPAGFRDRLEAAEQDARAGADPAEALGELSRLYHAGGFLAQAVACYRGLLRVEPGNPRWPYRYASILAGYGQLDQAVPLLQRTVALAPAYVPARIRLGDALLKLDRPDEAARAYEAALKLAPDQPYALFGLARLDVAAGRWAAARDRLENVVAATNFLVGYDLLPTVYEHLALPGRAAQLRAREKASGAYLDLADPWLDALLDDCYDTYRLSIAAGAANHRGDPARAVAILDRAIGLAPANAPLRLQLALICSDQRDFARARAELERCTALAPEFADGWAHLADLLTTLGDRAGAARAISAGLAHCPSSPGLHLARGRELAAEGRWPEAIPEFQASIRLRPVEAAAYVDLADADFQLDRMDDGVAELRRALAAEPENPAALSAMAMYAIQTGDAAAARAWLDRVRQQVRIGPDTAAAIARAFRERFGAEP